LIRTAQKSGVAGICLYWRLFASADRRGLLGVTGLHLPLLFFPRKKENRFILSPARVTQPQGSSPGVKAVEQCIVTVCLGRAD
jgi:hypothetical protein